MMASWALGESKLLCEVPKDVASKQQDDVNQVEKEREIQASGPS